MPYICELIYSNFLQYTEICTPELNDSLVSFGGLSSGLPQCKLQVYRCMCHQRTRFVSLGIDFQSMRQLRLDADPKLIKSLFIALSRVYVCMGNEWLLIRGELRDQFTHGPVPRTILTVSGMAMLG